MSSEVHALVLAAGGASRFGAPKQLAELHGRALLKRVLDQAAAVCPDRVTVVLGAYVAKTQALCDGVTPVHNPAWRGGLSSSLRTGIDALPASADAVLVMLCDQPGVSTEQYTELVRTWREHPGSPVAAAYAGTLGVPAVFPRRMFDQLRELTGDKGARAVLAKYRDLVVPVAIPEAVHDVDSPEDLAP
ncbi:MAG: nucleotidyltransferase family protein [Pseudomonadota bacterium]